MSTKYIGLFELETKLKGISGASLDFVVFLTGPIVASPSDLPKAKEFLSECARTLKPGGILLVQGLPSILAEIGVYLDQLLKFKYWIALDSLARQLTHGLPSAHSGLLMFSKGPVFNIEKTRFPHQYCAACGKTLKDWGGKAHLMHPDGYAISDVWRDIPKANNYSGLSRKVLSVVLEMVGATKPDKKGLLAPREGILSGEPTMADRGSQYSLPGFQSKKTKPSKLASRPKKLSRLYNIVHQGDILDVLSLYPDGSVDLVFADPPYNLEKKYKSYNDALLDEEYINWCNRWLGEYARILKPSGSLFVLNLPRWSMHHAKFLNSKLFFQNWIVWDALSEPRGKIMPAHYGLLYYTKSAKKFTFNYSDASTIPSRKYCLRNSCIKNRTLNNLADRDNLVDIWSDVHRIKHKRDRDIHPCQLPENIMERIIRLSTNKDDVVLDGFMGAGTTAVVAAKLGRRFVGIELDPYYVNVTRNKVMQVKSNGFVSRESIRKTRNTHTKKELQLELRNLAKKLGRLPTPDDVKSNSSYDLETFFAIFPTWGKALKAAKLEELNG